MILYLAGGINGNCKPLWTDIAKAMRSGCIDKYLSEKKGSKWCMDLYLAGTSPATKYQLSHINCGGEECMDLYLAGQYPWKKDGLYDKTFQDRNFDIAVLESFYYADEWTEAIIPKLDRFMLDSGAFTFFSAGKSVDWNEYLEKYAAFINKNNVKLFFELDIDSLVGYEKVLEFRRILERKTGKQPIPVWHKSRGIKEFYKMCDEYSYVAIGGIVSKEIKPQDYKYFPHFISEAHKRKAKIHGLGFTNLKGLEIYKFDSVDSTSWTTGNRFGAIYKFDGKTMQKYSKQEGQRLADSRQVAVHNFNEWVKFQEYAKKFL